MERQENHVRFSEPSSSQQTNPTNLDQFVFAPQSADGLSSLLDHMNNLATACADNSQSAHLKAVKPVVDVCLPGHTLDVIATRVFDDIISYVKDHGMPDGHLDLLKPALTRAIVVRITELAGREITHDQGLLFKLFEALVGLAQHFNPSNPGQPSAASGELIANSANLGTEFGAANQSTHTGAAEPENRAKRTRKRSASSHQFGYATIVEPLTKRAKKNKTQKGKPDDAQRAQQKSSKKVAKTSTPTKAQKRQRREAEAEVLKAARALSAHETYV